MFSNERNELRQCFFNAWQKFQNKSLLEPLEAQIIEIILQHPEYHDILNNFEKYQTQDFHEGNPFLHMSLHLALREQIKTNRPAGIGEIFQQCCLLFSDSLVAEHKMMECLEQVLWDAQQSGVMPDEKAYLELMRNILNR